MTLTSLVLLLHSRGVRLRPSGEDLAWSISKDQQISDVVPEILKHKSDLLDLLNGRHLADIAKDHENNYGLYIAWLAHYKEEFGERAAILEHDAGLPRQWAEIVAAAEFALLPGGDQFGGLAKEEAA